MKINKTQEQIYNRILINFGIAVLAYTILYFLYQRLYMKNSVTFTLAGICLAAGIVCYIFSKKKPMKNYGHMFIAFCIALLFTRLSVITATVIGMNNFLAMQDIYVFKKLMETRWEVIIVVVASIAYLVGMVIYNGILMKKIADQERLERKKKLHK